MSDLKPFSQSTVDHLRLVLETGQIGIWELDLQTGVAVRNKVHDEIFRFSEPAGQWTYDRFLEFVVDDDRARVDKLQQSAVANNHEWTFECKIRRMDGVERWISAVGRPLAGPSGHVEKLIGHVIDITQTKLREARLELLTDELNHRVRNMLAVIQSLVKLSASKASDIPSFSKSLEGRVSALARSHHLLVADGPATMTPSSILEMELDAFADLRERIVFKVSDEPALPGKFGQGLALVFHELITNAIKYGALSNASGSVDLSIEGHADRVCVTWKERNGPKVSDVQSAGFGSMLITSAIGPSGKVKLDYPPSGAECTIDLTIQ